MPKKRAIKKLPSDRADQPVHTDGINHFWPRCRDWGFRHHYPIEDRPCGIRVVPWPRVYADLRLVGVRGEDAAEHLREVMRGR